MNETATATVETLTAEVRTLVVGSRQITLSVARQLDEVPLSDLEVMGRVKIREGVAHVIGRGRPSGELAVAQFQERPQRFVLDVLGDEISAPARVCTRMFVGGIGAYLLVSGTRVRLDASAVRVKCEPFVHSGDTTCGITLASPADELAILDLHSKYLAAHELREKLSAAARQAPLIVLAGLR